MNVAFRRTWTQEQFFDWAEAQDERYEFDGVQPVAMTGGFNSASAIGVNLITALATRLRGTGCRPLGPDAGVETIDKAVRYPDALVTCSKFRGDDRKRYVIIESSRIGLTVLERASPDQAWQTTLLTSDDILRLPEIGIEIPVGEIYEDMTFPDQQTASA